LAVAATLPAIWQEKRTWLRSNFPTVAERLPTAQRSLQLAESIGKRLAQAAIVGKWNGKLVDLSHPLSGSHEVSIITDKDADGLYVMRHSTAHVLARRCGTYGAKLQYTIGPVIENGFFYDF